MSEQLRKTMLITVSILGLVLIVILVSSRMEDTGKTDRNLVSQEQDGSRNPSEGALPQPTGKVDDALLSAETGIASEAGLISESDGLVSGLFDDSSEVSSFSEANEKIEF